MSKLQRIILLAGAVVLAGIAVVPPWHITYPAVKLYDLNLAEEEIKLGYSPLFSPPDKPDFSDMLWKAKKPIGELRGGTVGVDMQRLFLEWVIAALLFGVAVGLVSVTSETTE